MHLLRPSLIVAALSMAMMAHLDADAHIDELAPIPDKDAFALVVIPDLRQTLARIESMAHGFNPKIPNGMLTTGLGALFNDPLLTNLGKGPVVAVVSAGVPIPSYAILVPALDAQKYVDAAANNEMIMSKVVGNLAVIAQSPDGAALGERVAGSYAQLSAKPLSVDLRISLAPDRLASAYGPFISAMLAMQLGNIAPQPTTPGSPAVTPEQLRRIVTLELGAGMELAADVSEVQTDISISDAALRIDQSVAAKPTSMLAKALVAPVAPSQPLAKRYLSAKADVMYKGQLTLMPWFDYGVDLLNRLKKKPEGKDLPIDAVVADMKTIAAAFTGESVGRLGSDEKGQLFYDAAMGITDQAQAQKALETQAEFSKHVNEFLGMTSGQNATMVLTKNVRTLGGLPVYRVSYKFNNPTPQQAMVMKFMLDREVVIGKDWLVTATDPHVLDTLSAAPGPGLTLSAESLMGAGRDYYIDANIPALLNSFLKNTGFAETPGISDVAKALGAAPASEPLTSTYSASSGRARIELRIPLAPFYFMSQKLEGDTDTAPSGNDVKPKDKASVF